MATCDEVVDGLALEESDDFVDVFVRAGGGDATENSLDISGT